MTGLDYAATLSDWFDADSVCLHGVSVDDECLICDREIDMEPMQDEALEAIAEYNAAYERGEELAYPHWADEVIKHQGE